MLSSNSCFGNRFHFFLTIFLPSVVEWLSNEQMGAFARFSTNAAFFHFEVLR